MTLIHKVEIVLQPVKNWHLYSEFKNGKVSGGFIVYVRMFCIIGALVLLIACINFVNLFTARSEKKAREVGVRKAIGSNRTSLIFQFLTESVLVTFIAAFFAVAIVQVSLPAFNALTGNMLKHTLRRAAFLDITAGVYFIYRCYGWQQAGFLPFFF